MRAGFLGLAAYVTLFVCAFRCAWRIRRRSKDARLDPADQRLYLTAANALMASMAGFLVGGWIGPKIARKVPAGPFRVIVSLCGIGLAVKLGMSAYH